MQKRSCRRTVSLVALAVAVGFIEVAVSVACPAVPAEALASPATLEESIRKSVRGRSGQQLLVRLSRHIAGSPDMVAPHISADHPFVLAARAMRHSALSASVFAPQYEPVGTVRTAASHRLGRAPPHRIAA